MQKQFRRTTRTLVTRSGDESGVALITALLAVMLMSAMMVGMFAALSASQRADMQDRDQTQAYAAAHAGLEKLTSSMAQLFATDWSPNASQINTLMTTPPVIPGFAFTAPGGSAGSGYAVTFTADGSGNPISTTADITTGPFTGFKGIITPYQVTVTASAPGGAEVRLRREIQTVAVPVLQFGVFSDSDLTFYAGDNFNFGGRVHTNKSLFVCEFAGTMTFSDRITAYQEVVHNYFSNGLSATTYSCTGNVLIPTSASTNRNLKQTPNEGSVTGMPGPGQTANPNWTTISTGGTYSGGTYYKSWIRTGLTGAKKLDLPLTSQGAAAIDLIRRPAVNSNEDTANKPVYGQRYYSQASLRILLSDRAADITALPAITGGAPVALSGNWLPGQAPPAGYTVGTNTPPIALSRGPVTATTPGSGTVTSGSSPNFTIKVTSTASFKSPNLTINTTTPQLNVVCTGKTATSFTGCTTTAVITPNTTITASGTPLPPGFVASTQTTNAANLAAGASVTIPVGSTANFAPLTFWVDQNFWQCTGYDATPAFTGCASTTATAVTNSKTLTSLALSTAGQPLIGGFIKIEKQDASGNWTDVTTEIIGLGIGDKNQDGNICSDPTPNAIIRIQRLRDNGSTATACSYNNSTNPYDWWPNTLYDPREGNFRTVATTATMNMGGVMQYISLDAGNLKKWLAGTIGTTGSSALNNNGYIVYFSDRRGDHNSADGDKETAQYGFEDQVNPTSAAGTPDNTLQTGEDMNGNGVQDTWGKAPSALSLPSGNVAPYSTLANTSGPQVTIVATNAGIARVNKVVLFRRALKLVNGGVSGGVNNLPTAGLTIASENPVYVQGNYNASAGTSSGLNTAESHVPAAIIADAVTLLSNNWSDLKSFLNPNNAVNRAATTTGYRFGAVAGKGLSFPHCGGNCGSSEFLFGTDGGVGNFLRLLEDWNTPNAAVNYRGSLISLFTSMQATGTFKYNTNVYDFAIRNFSFDTDFLTPQLLPPGTPMFRDINTLKFRQILRPNQ